ncbi:MAG: hypothetical protein CMJ81_21535 [Planctomycetaceae bacterium]|nr:hypothetical protein [Planctomycetaceae bacterium]
MMVFRAAKLANKAPAAPLRANLVANLLGRSWALVANLLFLPIYVKFLGVESYGLVGVYVSLLAVLSFAGLGLTATLSRETARLAGGGHQPRSLLDTVRTIEVAYVIAVAAVALILLCCAPLLGRNWFQVTGVSGETVVWALRLMSLAIAFQFIINLYDGGLLGLQRHVLMNSMRVSMGLVQSLGAVLLLWLVSPTIETFFIWQVLTTGCYAGCLRHLVWRNMPHSEVRPRFSRAVLERVWRYSASMVGLSVTAMVITQTDKIVLSRMLPLEVFGLYAIAWTLARAPLSLTAPVHLAFFPRLTQLATSGQAADVAPLYHRACQLVSVMSLPCLAVLAVFSRESLFVWLARPIEFDAWGPVLALLAIGTGAQAISQIPHTLQLAHGWPMLSVWLNTTTAACSVPLTIMLTWRWGATGAALSWALMSAVIVSIGTVLVLRRFLKGEARRWIFCDVLAPGLAAVIPVAIARLVVPADVLAAFSRPLLLLYLLGVWLAASLFAVLAAPELSGLLLAAVRNRWTPVRRSNRVTGSDPG